MTRTMNLSLRVCTGLLVTLALFLCPTPFVAQQNITDKAVLDWKIVSSGSDVQTEKRYTLFNVAVRQSIKYYRRGTFGGINLGWDTSRDLKNFTIEREGAQSGSPIKYGEQVAISIQETDEPYLRYAKRDIGINLTWSKKPIYEWIVVGGAEGTVVKANTPVALFNMVEKDFLIRAPRGGNAINLRWYLDRDEGGYKRAALKRAYGYIKDRL